MPKQKLLEDIRQRPARFYRVPGDVVRDRRFDDSERLEILRAWRLEADALVAGQIEGVIAEVESRLAVRPGHAAE